MCELTPFQKVAPCSSAAFITLAAAGWSRPFHGMERPTDLGQLGVAICVSLRQVRGVQGVLIRPKPTGPIAFPAMEVVDVVELMLDNADAVENTRRGAK